MIGFIQEHRSIYGVEPIGRVLPIAPSTYYLHAARQADPAKRPARVQRDAALLPQIRRIWDENRQVYGAQKVWRQLRVNRQFHADRPDALWVSDYTYVSTWQGFAYVAFVIDVYARRIVGWKVSASQHTQFVLDALEQALHARRPGERLVHHSDRGSQYVSIRYTERLAEAGIEPSVGSVGDSYDNALAETINGLYKAEVVHRQSWRSREQLELETLRWVDWFNHRRLLGSIGWIPPAEAEANYHQQQRESAIVA